MDDFDDDVIDLVVQIAGVMQERLRIIASTDSIQLAFDEIAELIQEFKND